MIDLSHRQYGSMNSTTNPLLLKRRKNMKTILEELKEIEAKVSALIKRIESEDKSVVTTVGEVRKIAILEEVYRLGGIATAQQISDFARKYGKTPSSTAGYYSGNKPSLIATADREARELTETGKQVVKETREKWGDNWLDRIPLDIVGNEYTQEAEVSF